MKSITYYIVSFAIWLKQTKKIFSNDPIDYKRLRKDDIKIPSKKHLFGLFFNSTKINNCLITELLPDGSTSKKVILYFHGGALVYGPTQLHWNTISHIVKDTRTKAFLVDYPKAPEYQIREVNAEIDAIYKFILNTNSPDSIIFMGDSAGATLAMLLIQRLVKKELPLPRAAIFITPVLDCSMSNTSISNIERKDLMLSRKGVVSAKKMSAGRIDLHNEEISPLYGSFKGFVPTYLFTATHDVMHADAKLFEKKLEDSNVKIEVTVGKGMPHIWPLLPFMTESKIALNKISEIIKGI
jgi:acetyl esterase/lipase